MFEKLLMKLFKYEEITDNCQGIGKRPVYLRRFYIRKNKVGQNRVQVYLHHILRSDPDEELHDHPWSFLTFILWGGYREETESGIRFKPPGSILWRPSTWKHRLHLTRPAWTLVFTTRKQRSWGFWRKTGEFIHWKSFSSRNCK